MNRGLAALLVVLLLTGCREVRVKSYTKGTTEVPGGNAVVVVRDRAGLEALGIKAPVRFNHEFGVVLLMGPHHELGWRQVIESIRANTSRVRIVAFEVAPVAGADAAPAYRTFTLWIVPILVYRRGSHIDVVTPSDEPIASTVLP
ncbi:MAG: hypothetical protein JOZ59_01405 [Candidatus Eremiobacteraeota bacterium]|nr:hypothetical protein [Candidatus Eremiobacteraeota bacterium]